MYIAMNRFKIKQGEEQHFIDLWKNRDSHLKEIAGFISFNLLQGSTQDGYTAFASHTKWTSEETFTNWTHSDAFRKAHANAGNTSTRELYLEPPQLECFNTVI